MLSDSELRGDVPTTASLAGRLLGGRYVIGAQIGRGGMSTVYRAEDRALGRAVAVKVIRFAPDASREHLRERFRREAANAARIPSHSNVVQTFDYGTDPELDVDFIAMEFLDGVDLRTALQQNTFSIEESVQILLGAARGLAAGHRVGIVHRDVKPGNIFLVGGRQWESVRILDFGIAKALTSEPDDDLTRLTGVPHTPAYAAPEQWGAHGQLTPASDVYQLGLVAYELLAGERPFDAELRERIQAGETLPLPVRGRWAEVPVGIRSVVERALHRDPTARYRDAGAFAEAFAGASEEDRTLFAKSAATGDQMATGIPPTGGAQAPGPALDRSPVAQRDHHPLFARRPWMLFVAVVALILLFAVLRSNGNQPAGSAGLSNAPDLEEEFAPLYREAMEGLQTE